MSKDLYIMPFNEYRGNGSHSSIKESPVDYTSKPRHPVKFIPRGLIHGTMSGSAMPLGFVYTRVPNHFYDKIMPTLTYGPLKVMLYVIRRTLGFHKQWDFISMSQFTSGIVAHDGSMSNVGCGLTASNVRIALKVLTIANLLTCLLWCSNTTCGYYVSVLDTLPIKCPECGRPIQHNFHLRRMVGFTDVQYRALCLDTDV